ncbi:VanZ family protein [Marinobacter sp.]|uniref:VanZ family protein n=1 Tax=Marinobacter sp. TaxID=50741 RepID=UPI001A021734|nr:VanZ family protein [Marinobacter sp.]MBE0485845.1 VanZ family protein [Marinobacter sp.]
MPQFWHIIETILRMRLLWRAVLVASIAAILYLATTSSSYPIPSAANDKVNHIIAFIELTIVTRLAWPRLSAYWYVPALLSFGFALEVVQAQLPYRNFSMADVLADAFGIAIGMLPWPGIRSARQPDLRDSPDSL